MCPHAEHVSIGLPDSCFISVSGFPHFGHSTNLSAYSFIFALICDADTFLPNTSLFPDISPGVASCFNKYFSRWAWGLLSVSAICVKFDITVLFPSILPDAFGISNLALSKTTAGISFTAFLSSSLYSIYLLFFIPF